MRLWDYEIQKIIIFILNYSWIANRQPHKITMFLSLHQSRRMLLPILCILLISICKIESFEVARQVKSPFQQQQQRPSSTFSVLTCTSPKLPVQSSSCSLIVLDAKKKKIVEEEEEREQPRGLGLVLLFMTPWRNPNSIFVYMLLIVYGLGTYSELKASGALWSNQSDKKNIPLSSQWYKIRYYIIGSLIHPTNLRWKQIMIERQLNKTCMLSGIIV